MCSPLSSKSGQSVFGLLLKRGSIEIVENGTHFADVIARKGAEKAELLPIDHVWVCNASLPSWPAVLRMREHLPCIYLCTDCARELGVYS